MANGETLMSVVVEPTEEHLNTVIWLHGLGASGHDFEPVVPLLGCPNTRFVFPHAPEMPVTINMGMVMPAWYDIKTLDWNAPDREDEVSIRANAELVTRLVAEEVSMGVPYRRIVLAGFSQGGALALHIGLRLKQRLAGVMVLSAYQLLSATFSEERSEENQDTPLLFCHGLWDDMVPHRMGESSYERVKDAGHPCQWHSYRMGHEVIMDELGEIRNWLHRVLY